MPRHFGVLIPSTNTTAEVECRLLPATYQAHVWRLMSSGREFLAERRERGEEGVLSPLPPRNSLKTWWAVKDSNLGPLTKRPFSWFLSRYRSVLFHPCQSLQPMVQSSESPVIPITPTIARM